MAKRRLDQLLVDRGLYPTRTKAQAAIMAGSVRVEGHPRPKAGMELPEDAAVEVVADACPYVSRGGLKLAGALDAFGVDPKGRVALDVGASTGGFTDCLLQRGATLVHAIDVGHGQLDSKLRADPRVRSREGVHARDLTPEQFDPRPDLCVIDVSFISLTKVLPPVVPCLKRPFDLVALIKPQFELEPKKTPKGIVRLPEHRAEAVERVREAAKALGLVETGLIESPIHGAKGNVELLIRYQELISARMQLSPS
ncbi:MAG: TlyA family RNA methyltransferase [Elusimicrobia bacterium]|nr:TlyA family RNA methyltransferase [Elusimicrobiota bacterium]